MGDSELVQVLGNILMENTLLSVEIVPGGIEQWAGQAFEAFPFLLTDGHLGVPQKILYKLYLSAVVLLDAPDPSSQLNASCVALLANPAHQTALNTRKRLMHSSSSALAELAFSARLMASSRPCSKESILWAHRRWIFAFLYPHQSLALPTIPPNIIETEFELISTCCELYPRNYHAWSHHFFVVECIHASLRDSQLDSPYLPIFEAQLHYLRSWIQSHVSDYSAMHQLRNMVARLQSLSQFHSILGELADSNFHVEHAISLVKLYPSREAPWMYLRAIIGIWPAQERVFSDLAESSTETETGPMRDRFIVWVNRRRQVIQI